MSVVESLDRPRREQARRERRLQVVPDSAGQPSRAPFVLLVVVILGVGLVGLLLLNTSLQQGSFAIHDLNRTTSQLEERQGVLEQRVATLQAPETLASRAQSMGMVPNTNPVFLRLSDGVVLGDAVPAKPRVTAQPTPTGTPGGQATPPAGQQTVPPGRVTPGPNGRPTPAPTQPSGQGQNHPSRAPTVPTTGGNP
ncbi:hypothetical protein [Actinopolymorpha alba]|uniref:hypothetical protein n=1 Tax=Actinopolymorpha alba TaxID=533267 RepID=UPI000373AC8B|nr:hypothetical protein [Actinopolymorpha alba]